MNYILTALILYILSGMLQTLFKGGNKFNFLIILNLISSVFALVPVFQVLSGGSSKEFLFNFGSVIGNSSFLIDQLSAFFILIIVFISFLALIYGKKYLFPYENENKLSAHLFLYNLFIFSMICVVLASNVLLFLIFWEIMSLASFLLMMYEGEKADVRKISVQYFVMMHVCVLFLILGFAILNIKTGSLSFSDFKGNIDNLVFVLLFIGFGIKAGFVPLHTWLPSAHPAAPSHISAVMSGVMIKTGIYGILRILTLNVDLTLFVSYLVLFIGVLSGFFGILYAICQRDFKKMLAYSSVENMGIIAIAFGVGLLGVVYKNEIMASLGFIAGFMHILNHSIFKPLMFFSAGSVYKQTGTKDMEKLGGLVKVMPISALCFLFGSLAISAIPPFNGFISEFLIYLGSLNSFSTHNYFLISVIILTVAILAFIGAMALIAFTNAFSVIFLGTLRSNIEVKSDVSGYMKAPVIILVLISAFIGVFPQYAVNIVQAPVSLFTNFRLEYDILSSVSSLNIALILLFSGLFILRYFLLKSKKVSYEKTWGCGYDRESSRVQYTANSFTRPFLGFLTPFYERVLEFKQIKELFPSKTSFKSKIYDIFDNYLIRPVVKMDEFIIKKFYWIQSGNTQRYLWYGVLALIISIILVLGDKI